MDDSGGSSVSSDTVRESLIGENENEVQMLQQDKDGRYYGKNLVRKVYDDQLALNSANIGAAWRNNAVVVKKEVEKHVVETLDERAKSSSNWSIQKPIGIKKIIIESVQPSPPMIYWTETFVNIPTADSKFLTHIPHIDEETEKRSKKNDFCEELLEMYDGNLHSDTDLDISSILPDNLELISYIRVMMNINENYGDVIFSEIQPTKRNKRKSIRIPSTADLQKCYQLVQIMNENLYAMKLPTMKLLTMISETVLPDVEAQELMNLYIKLVQRRNPECFNTRMAPINVDTVENVVTSKEAQMDSYASLFCRLCFKYACVEHTALLTKSEISLIQSTVTKQRNEKIIPPKKLHGKSTVQNEKVLVCEFKDCCKKASGSSNTLAPGRVNVKPTWRNVLSQWTPTERTLFTCHYDSFKDYCLVALMLATKTCQEVKEYHQLSTQNQTCSKKTDTTANTSSSKSKTVGDLSSIAITTCKMNSEARGISSTRTEMVLPCTSSSSDNGMIPADTDNSACDLSNDEDIMRELCTFIPCCHENGVCDDNCNCVLKKTFCESACGCLRSCKNRFKGCVCLTTCDSKRCPCFVAARECDPDLCKRCGSHEIDLDKVTCKNVAIQRRLCQPIEIKKSTVSGLGAFAGIDINKGEFIDEYTAERISSNEAEKRGHVYDKRRHTFLFQLTPNIVLDASRIGNKTRFINSSKRPNCGPVHMNVRGEMRLAIRALKDIKKGEELFFNYHEVLKSSKRNSTKRMTKYVKK